MRFIWIWLFLVSGSLVAEEVPAFLDRWAAAEATAGNMRVEFQQEVKNPALKQAVKSEGTLWRFADGTFRWELGKPARTVMIKNGPSLRTWDSADGQWKTLAEDDRRFRLWLPLLMGKGLGAATLTKDFNATLLAVDGSQPELILVPKAGMARKYVKEIRLELSAPSLRLRRLTINQADGGSTKLAFAEPSAVAEGERVKVVGE